MIAMKQLRTCCVLVVCVLLLSLGLGCDGRDSSQSSDANGNRDPIERSTPQVYVVNYPSLYVTKRIVEDHLEVVLPEASGADPAFWNPSDDVVLDYQRADLVLLWGADYAKWVKRVSLPFGRVVDTGAAIREQYIFDEGAVTHSHGSSGAHSHGTIAFNTWLDFDLLLKQSRSIHETLTNRFPRHALDFESAFRSLESDLTTLDEQAQQAVPEAFKDTLFSSHPVYQYFGRRYGLTLVNFHWEPGLTPSKEEWNVFQERLEETKAKWMLWVGAPSAPARNRMKEFGVTPIVFPTLGGRPEGGDFLSIMRANVEKLRVALGQE